MQNNLKRKKCALFIENTKIFKNLSISSIFQVQTSLMKLWQDTNPELSVILKKQKMLIGKKSHSSWRSVKFTNKFLFKSNVPRIKFCLKITIKKSFCINKILLDLDFPFTRPKLTRSSAASPPGAWGHSSAKPTAVPTIKC